jgi:ElaB/YqjD/DUF883 family membrane-anchored ribosome-binding protein
MRKVGYEPFPIALRLAMQQVRPNRHHIGMTPVPRRQARFAGNDLPEGETAMAAEILEKSATLDDILHEVAKIKSIVTDAVDDGMRSALRAVKQGRAAAEDVIDDAIHSTKKAVKQNPLEAMGILFAAGLLAGGLLTWSCTRRR